MPANSCFTYFSSVTVIHLESISVTLIILLQPKSEVLDSALKKKKNQEIFFVDFLMTSWHEFNFDINSINHSTKIYRHFVGFMCCFGSK